jgi:4-hydroxy-tetrahydrodipicolinate synthase
MRWDGTIAGVALPLTDEEAIDWTSLQAHLESFVGCGLSGIVINADTGEGPLLTASEREAVLRFALAEVGDRLPVATGLLAPNTAEAIAAARGAAALGASAFQVFSPPAFLGRPLEWKAVVGYYAAIAASTDVPLIVYQAPEGLGVTFDLEVLKRLADLPGVAAIKESSWNEPRFRETAAIFAGDRHGVALLTGEDTFILRSLRAGADGAMLAAAALDPAVYAAMVAEPDAPAAAEVQAALDPYLARLFAPPLRNFRARIKAVLAGDGVIAGAAVRSPMLQIGEGERTALLEMIAETRARLAPLSR